MRVTFDQLISAITEQSSFDINAEQKVKIQKTYEFLLEFSDDKVIYGINTGFGPMAQYKIAPNDLKTLQYNLVRSHAAGTGNVLTEEQTRAAMICRLNSLSLAKSGVSMGVIETLETYLNANIYPEIYCHGGVGASGDLVQLAHLALGLIGEGYAYHNGERHKTADLLKEKNITPLDLKLRDGLALINGTSCMSGLALLNIWKAQNLIDWSIKISAMINEIISSYDDSFSAELNGVKQHKGQQEVAERMRTFLTGSQLIKKREDHLFKNASIHPDKFVEKVQEYYSIRCVPQIIGPIVDTIDYAQKTVVDEVNSANDNPITIVEANNVFHGGNFHGDYISFEMDKVKIAITKLSMLMERQLNYLLNARLNEKFPPFLNKGTLGLNFGLQAMQFTATSTTAENQTLSNPMYVHSISCNNDNQDIVSMGTNSALIADTVIENTYQVLAIELIAIAQAIDISECKDKIGAQSLAIFNQISELAAGIDKDEPGFEKITRVRNFLTEELYK
ncbi:HAL/PAL/TAL family ammonia-lyase [Crocinitomix catalasitica]|uniref:HAL/PAL/TAL family ammonia-lyase n=1 Tax=Crocinitomix catalasitica TaxID=184607 RepID=UPI0004802336|nr:aromatic amino acid ammonia-lyase [Crocinitomix catalasitica]